MDAEEEEASKSITATVMHVIITKSQATQQQQHTELSIRYLLVDRDSEKRFITLGSKVKDILMVTGSTCDVNQW